jgi:glycerol-3-phosphate acyltransferase PlsY
VGPPWRYFSRAEERSDKRAVSPYSLPPKRHLSYNALNHSQWGRRERLDPTVKCILFAVGAYLIGSIPIGLIICQIWAGIDIREYGSGNIGMTNVYRTLRPTHGHLPWLMTLALDFAKGYLPVHLSVRWLSNGEQTVGAIFSIYIALIVLAVMLGNLFPIYIYFKGGKGVATGLGVFSALIGLYILIPVGAFFLFLVISRMVSIGSIAAATAIPIAFYVMGKYKWGLFNPDNPDFQTLLGPPSPAVFVTFTIIIAAVVFFKHKANIARIIAGTERKIWTSKMGEKDKAETNAVEETEPEEPAKLSDVDTVTTSGEVDADG